MTVQDFINKYNEFSNDTLREKLCDEIMKNEYVPYTRKMAVCKSIAKATTHSTYTTNPYAVNGETKEYFFTDSANRYLLFRIKLLQEYTLLEFNKDSTKAITDYELLDKYGINEILTDRIDEREYAAFKMILDMYVDDYMVNENSIVNYLDNKFEAFRIAADTVLDGLKEFIQSPEVTNVLDSLIQEKNDDNDNNDDK